jgi:predicted RNase H-like HicB family nuclease
MNYAVIIEQTNDGPYWAYVPDLPTCATLGNTIDEALVNIRDAIECYAEEMAEMGQPMPTPTITN